MNLRAPQIKINALSYAKLVRALTQTPRTKPELAEITGLHIWTCRGYVDALHNEEVIHIVDWRKDGMGRDTTPVYQWGMGVDMKRRAKSGAQKARDRRARRRQELLDAQKASLHRGVVKNFDED